MKRHLIVGLAITSSLLVVAPLGAMAAAAPRPGGLAAPAVRMETQSTMHVFDLNERPLVRPRQFVISETSRLIGLRWRSWGGPLAIGVGHLVIDTCNPDCAQGRRVSYRAQLQLRGSQEEDGADYYELYRVVGGPSLPLAIRREYSDWSLTDLPSSFE